MPRKIDTPTNLSRAARIHVAKKRYCRGEYDDESPETFAVDLLADIRHFCDKHQLEFHKLNKLAYGHYTAEVVGERSRR